jgi:hypothetical protein
MERKSSIQTKEQREKFLKAFGYDPKKWKQKNSNVFRSVLNIQLGKVSASKRKARYLELCKKAGIKVSYPQIYPLSEKELTEFIERAKTQWPKIKIGLITLYELAQRLHCNRGMLKLLVMEGIIKTVFAKKHNFYLCNLETVGEEIRNTKTIEVLMKEVEHKSPQMQSMRRQAIESLMQNAKAIK